MTGIFDGQPVPKPPIAVKTVWEGQITQAETFDAEDGSGDQYTVVTTDNLRLVERDYADGRVTLSIETWEG